MNLRLSLFVLLFQLSISDIKCSGNTSISFMPSNYTEPNEPTTQKRRKANSTSFDMKSILKIVLSAQTGLDTLNTIQESILDVPEQTKLEEHLQTQLKIAAYVYTHYGVAVRSPTWQKCSDNYGKRKETLVLEVKAIKMICERSIEAVQASKKAGDGLGFLLPSSILQLCGDEALHLYENAQNLQSLLFYESFGCSLEVTTRTFEELIKTTYFDHVHRKNLLLAEELQLLLGKYKTYIAELNATSISNIERLMMNKQLGKFSQEVKTLRGEEEENPELKHEVQLFKESVLKIPAAYPGTFKTDLVTVAKYVKTEIFEKFLKIQKPLEEDSLVISKPKSPYGHIKRVVLILARLSQMISVVTDKIPTEHFNDQKFRMFTGVSETIGKPCENSPSHLSGTCTSDNNEICRKIPEWAEMDPLDRISNDNLIISDIMLLTKYCTCGFQEKCIPTSFTYQIATEYAVCFLMTNGDGQCRGSVGYPCKSQPLAEGEFDQSCASDKCNQWRDECV